jgi:RNA polymerase sigma factor (sigma-70 family)
MASRSQDQTLNPDEEVVRLFQQTRDPDLFAELFSRHSKRVYFACRAFYSESSAAEDATQETFLRAYEKMHLFAGGDFAGWLLRIAKNICIDGWRKRKPESDAAETDVGDQGIEGIAAVSTVDLRDSAAQVWHEMAALPAEQRQCLEMKIEGYSYEETAARLGLSVDAVKSHLQNGRRMLWLRMEGSLGRAGKLGKMNVEAE